MFTETPDCLVDCSVAPPKVTMSFLAASLIIAPHVWFDRLKRKQYLSGLVQAVSSLLPPQKGFFFFSVCTLFHQL